MHLQKTGFLETICEIHLSMHCLRLGHWKRGSTSEVPMLLIAIPASLCIWVFSWGRKVPSFIKPLLDNKSFQSGLVIKVGVVSSMKFGQLLRYSDVDSPTVKADCLSCKVLLLFFKLPLLAPSTAAPLGARFSWAYVHFPPHSLSPDGCLLTFCKTSWARGRVTNHSGLPRTEGVSGVGDFQANHEGWLL